MSLTIKRETTTKITEAERRQMTIAEISGTDLGVTNPSENHQRNVVAFNRRNWDMRDCGLVGYQEMTAEKECGSSKLQHAGECH